MTTQWSVNVNGKFSELSRVYMKEERPSLLMIGEAPGYRGTSISGVPFLSEQIITARCRDNLRLPIKDYAWSSVRQGSGYEATSTTMWSTLDVNTNGSLPLPKS